MTIDARSGSPARLCRAVAFHPDPAGGVTEMVSLAAGQVAHKEVRMMKHAKTLGAALVMATLLAALPGCQKEAGPAERAGKEVDKAAEKVGESIEKAGDSIQDAAKGDKK